MKYWKMSWKVENHTTTCECNFDYMRGPLRPYAVIHMAKTVKA